MTATNYLEDRILNHVLRNTAYIQPTGLYMALHTADPGEVGTGNEVVGGSYAPQAVVFTAVVAGTGQAVSSGAVSFAGMPAATVTHFTIRDAPTGNPLFYGPLSAPQVVSAGATLAFNAGQVVISCD
jgi:hypothetical protein